MRSKSRGWVRLKSRRSARDAAHPVQLYEPSRRLDGDARLRAPDARDFRARAPSIPIAAARSSPARMSSSDEAIDAFVREHVESAYHPSCTCKMGATDDPLAVVDPRDARDRRRGACASSTPRSCRRSPSGNLNAPTIMIGEKAADMIRGRRPLPASNAPYYVAPDGRRRSGERLEPSSRGSVSDGALVCIRLHCAGAHDRIGHSSCRDRI